MNSRIATGSFLILGLVCISISGRDGTRYYKSASRLSAQAHRHTGTGRTPCAVLHAARCISAVVALCSYHLAYLYAHTAVESIALSLSDHYQHRTTEGSGKTTP